MSETYAKKSDLNLKARNIEIPQVPQFWKTELYYSALVRIIAIEVSKINQHIVLSCRALNLIKPNSLWGQVKQSRYGWTINNDKRKSPFLSCTPINQFNQYNSHKAEVSPSQIGGLSTCERILWYTTLAPRIDLLCLLQNSNIFRKNRLMPSKCGS